ncbi:MAG: FAD-dependent oxidoreductase [Candidatus Hydrogenedentes bacterium]|nr:FAD-dependent oxidoreductase [Candidatus Hydrogenedentota bacterium]
MTDRFRQIAIVVMAVFGATPAVLAASSVSTDVVVVGATPGGIAAAIAAARLGHEVVLVEYQRHVGGMSASGLGKSDVQTHGAIQGIFREFIDLVHRYYVEKYGVDSQQVKDCREGYFYEPSVAEHIFEGMLGREKRITVLLGQRLEEAARHDRRVTAVSVMDRKTGRTRELRAQVFIDATYEGDLAAYAGAAYRLGREGRAEYDEAHAGVIYLDHTTRSFRPGSSGLGDDRLTAYTFRLCLSRDPVNSVPIGKPADYDRARYLGYFEDLRLGRLDSALKALSIAPLPNQKTDVNMKPWPLGFPFAEENQGYVEADWTEREKIIERIRNITLGLVYFLQHDQEIPTADQEAARAYGLAKDEFSDNGHFPWQLYVREARRIAGEYTLTEHDLVLAPESGRAPVHADAIATGEFPIDSFPTRQWEPGHNELEGYILMLKDITKPYQIPYRTMAPQAVDGLLVPVALSASHIAFSSLRMEPTWMTLGQAAGTAAHLALRDNAEVREVNVDAAYVAMQYYGTKGFFADYAARPRDVLARGQAAQWLLLALRAAGRSVSAEGIYPGGWKDLPSGSPHFAAAAALAAAGIVPPPQSHAEFRPNEPLIGEELRDWLAKTSWPASTENAAVAPVSWRYESGTSPSTPVTRGEFCRAAFAVLGNT